MARTPADVDAAAHVFVDALDERVTIAGDDGHHLQRVRRLSAGERVTAADGSGAWRVYEIAAIGDGELALSATSAVEHVRAPSVRIALAVALTKAGLDGVVPALTELGVARITPVVAERSVVRWDAAKATHVLGRLRAAAREAAMQCRRADVPEIAPLARLADLVADDVVVADRAGVPASELAVPASGVWTVLVGPEGGFEARELAAFEGRPRLSVGRHVMRATTAPIAVAAVLAERIAQNDR
jgi:16S rRNA (uracil1498-N3)-methyltransferase